MYCRLTEPTHGDAGGQQFLDILPAVRVAASLDIVVGQPVDQAHLRMPRRIAGTLTIRTPSASSMGTVSRVSSTGRVRPGYWPAGRPRRRPGRARAGACFVEHTHRLTDAGSIAQENLESPARVVGYHRPANCNVAGKPVAAIKSADDAAWRRAGKPGRAGRSQPRRFPVAGPGVLSNVLRCGRLRNGEDRGKAQQKPQRNLAGCGPALLGDLTQHPPARRIGIGEIVVTERTVGNHRRALLLAPGDHGVFDGALLEVIQHLVHAFP